MSITILFITFILFIILTPGVLLYIPSKKSILVAAVIHGIIFTFILAIIINSKLFNINIEYFQDQECMCPVTDNIKTKIPNIDDSEYSKGIVKLGDNTYNSYKSSDINGCTPKTNFENCGPVKCQCPPNSKNKAYRNYYRQCKIDLMGTKDNECNN